MLSPSLTPDAIDGGTRRHLLVLFGVLVAAAVVAEAVAWTEGHAHLHTVMEVPAMVLAWVVGVLALVRYYAVRNDAVLLLGVGFVGTALLDGYHAIVTSAAFVQYFPSSPASLIPWSWTASRLFLGVLMVGSWWVWSHQTSRDGEGAWSPRVVYLAAGGFTLVTFAFFAFAPLGPAYFPDWFFARPQEFITAVFYAVAFWGYWSSARAQASPLSKWILASLLVSGFSQAVIMSRSQALFDAHFDMAHMLKLLSYLLVLWGLLLDVYVVWSRDRRQTAELRLLTAELADKNLFLEQTKIELEQFTFIASHDLQTPLREMYGSVQMLAEEVNGEMGEMGQMWMQHALRSAEQMKAIVDALVAYRNVEQGAPFRAVALDDVFKQAYHTLETAIAEGKAHITADPLPTVHGDRAQLVQVFIQLLGNALRYSGDAPARVHVSARATKGRFEIAVADEGIGIDPSQHERIFEMFTRLYSRKEHPGTGAGLAVVRRIVQWHGGDVRVASALGQGSTFIVTLPHPEEKPHEQN